MNRGPRYAGNICISGLTAAGKTTHSHLLAGELGLTYVSGSQIQLNFLGVSPIQTREFWITAEARKLWNHDDFRKIDSELLRIEGERTGCIFDTSTMPWRHRSPALCVWLASDPPSRISKAIVSHRGATTIDLASYADEIARKDKATTDLYRELYDIEIGGDLSPFDLVLDISSLITEPTLDASLSSIRIAHELIRSASLWYLTGRSDFREAFELAVTRHSRIVRRDGVAARVAAKTD